MAALCMSSGIKNTGSSLIYAGKSIVSGLAAISDSTNIATVTIYDNAVGDTSGVVIARVNATINTGTNCLTLATPVRCDLGVSITVSGAGTPQGIVYYGA